MIEYKIWCSYIIWYNILYYNIIWYNSLSETQYSQHFNISTLQLVSQHFNIATGFSTFNISTFALCFNISTFPLLCTNSTFQHLDFSTLQHSTCWFNIQRWRKQIKHHSPGMAACRLEYDQEYTRSAWSIWGGTFT